VADKRLLIPLETRMSDYGYWVVTVGCASGQHMSMMVAQTGITPMQATELALSGVTHSLEQVGAP
jgi:RNase adaptor protein for sRNA GlmZ degradation